MGEALSRVKFALGAVVANVRLKGVCAKGVSRVFLVAQTEAVR